MDWYDWPQVEYPNIYNFLIETPSVYTGESLKSYKSLDAYNFYRIHETLTISKSGLAVDVAYTFMGASPDGKVKVNIVARVFWR